MVKALRTASIACLAIWAAVWLLFLLMRLSPLDIRRIPGVGMITLAALGVALLAPIAAIGLAGAASVRQPRVPLNWITLGCAIAAPLARDFYSSSQGGCDGAESFSGRKSVGYNHKDYGGVAMHSRLLTLTLLIGFIAARQAAAQTAPPSHPCSLLTAAQISAAVGTVGESREGDMPGTGHGANPLRRACSWSVPGGLLTLSAGKVPNPSLSTRQLLDYMNSMYDLLKGQGWKYEKKDFGGTSCSMLTPPAGSANGSPATICATVVKGMLVMAGTSTKVSIPAEKLKSLAETAATRLP